MLTIASLMDEGEGDPALADLGFLRERTWDIYHRAAVGYRAIQCDRLSELPEWVAGDWGGGFIDYDESRSVFVQADEYLDAELDTDGCPDTIWRTLWRMYAGSRPFRGTLGARRWGERRAWRPLREAIEYVRSLGFTSTAAYRAWAESSGRPYDIPYDPLSVYGMRVGEFIGLDLPDFLPFLEAREVVRAAELPSARAYAEWVRNRRREGRYDLPANPDRFYRQQWHAWYDWLGKQWMSYEEARDFARSLELGSAKEWERYAKSKVGQLPTGRRVQRPRGIPARPDHVYRQLGVWKGWGDFLGLRSRWRPFEQAREFARSLGLSTSREWRQFVRSPERPPDIPANPDQAYAEWASWRDWLSRDAPTAWVSFRPFAEARDFVRALGFPKKRRAAWPRSSGIIE